MHYGMDIGTGGD